MLTLDNSGILLALVFGFLFYVFGGVKALAIMLGFLFLAVFATRFGYYEKKMLGVYEYQRGWKNVLSNGLFPLIFAYFIKQGNILGFLGSVAAITSDKLSSEIGVFDKNVWDILSLKKVKPGKSGGISWLGLFSALMGAWFIAILGLLIYNLSTKEVALVIFSGFLGSIADSIAGSFEEKGLGNKETSNLIGSFAGGITAVILKAILL